MSYRETRKEEREGDRETHTEKCKIEKRGTVDDGRQRRSRYT